MDLVFLEFASNNECSDIVLNDSFKYLTSHVSTMKTEAILALLMAVIMIVVQIVKVLVYYNVIKIKHELCSGEDIETSFQNPGLGQPNQNGVALNE